MVEQQKQSISWKKFEQVLDKDLYEIVTETFESMTELQNDVLEYCFDQEKLQLQSKELGSFVVAPAGNGKTLCFCIPALQWVKFDQPLMRVSDEKTRFKGKYIQFKLYTFLPQVVIIVDTQSLVDQITAVIKSITPDSGKWKDLIVQKLYKNINLHEMFDKNGQIRGFHILVSTPDLLDAKFSNPQLYPDYPTRVSFEKTIFFVIDEAEQVIANSKDAIERLIKGNLKENIRGARDNANLNIMLTSATLDRESRDNFKYLWYQDTEFQSFKVDLTLDGVYQFSKQLKSDNNEEAYDEVIKILKDMFIEKKMNTQVMVFMDEIKMIDSFERKLIQVIGKDSLKFDSYHSKKENKEKVLEDFRNGQFEVLFTTNVLARGIDIRNVSLVINVFVPRKQKKDKNNQYVNYIDSKIYMHRVGRTGRFKDKGVAITLLRGQSKEYGIQDKQLHEELVNFVTQFQCQERIQPQQGENNDSQQVYNELFKKLNLSDDLSIKYIENYETMFVKIEEVIKFNKNSTIKRVDIIKQKEKVVQDQLEESVIQAQDQYDKKLQLVQVQYEKEDSEVQTKKEEQKIEVQTKQEEQKIDQQ